MKQSQDRYRTRETNLERVERIRNFSIVAHIDHGKSTLADRILERAGMLAAGKQQPQVLDDMELERERGITIKAKAVRLDMELAGSQYMLNLIDTPGHVDFTNEVSRSLKACEGVVLLVDAFQGVQAQTVSNMYLALENELEIIPVINKIDLATARTDEVILEMVSVLGVVEDEILKVSAKTGEGVNELLEAIVERVPPPSGGLETKLRALLFDSAYDRYQGVVVYIRLVSGRIRAGDRIRTLGAGKQYEVSELGVFTPQRQPVSELCAGEVGYFTAAIKEIGDVKIGDTVADASDTETEPLPGYAEPLPMVYCGLYPAETTEYASLRTAMDKLRLSDASITYQPEVSDALGFGMRCGFLGLLHMEIVQERLERESDIMLIQTAPTVRYQILKKDGSLVEINRPGELPLSTEIAEFREPIVEVSLIVATESIGGVLKLCEDRRGSYISTAYLTPQRAMLLYNLPLAEIIYDFFDKLKSLTRGYGTMDYKLIGFLPADLVKLEILVNEKPVDALSVITHKSSAQQKGRAILKTLQKQIPRHLFKIPLQSQIGGKIIARENIAPLRKNVTAKCYGGDVTRKRKLLQKQRDGKKRMRQVGNVRIPQDAFLAVLKAQTDKR